MTPATRRAVRWLHILGAMVLGTYLYAPWSAEPVFRALVLFGVFPAIGLSGIWLWQGARIGRLLGGRRSRQRLP